MTEFNLTEKIQKIPKGLTCACGSCDISNIKTRHVKEFIRLLEVEWNKRNQVRTVHDFMDFIKDKAGEDLI